VGGLFILETISFVKQKLFSPSASNPGDGVSEVVLSLSHQRGKKQNKNKQTKKNTKKCPKFKCNTVPVSFSARRCSSVVVSSKEERKKKILVTVL
jgi:hypothetical protein